MRSLAVLSPFSSLFIRKTVHQFEDLSYLQGCRLLWTIRRCDSFEGWHRSRDRERERRNCPSQTPPWKKKIKDANGHSRLPRHSTVCGGSLPSSHVANRLCAFSTWKQNPFINHTSPDDSYWFSELVFDYPEGTRKSFNIRRSGWR